MTFCIPNTPIATLGLIQNRDNQEINKVASAVKYCGDTWSITMADPDGSRRENLNAKNMGVWNQLGWRSRGGSARPMEALRSRAPNVEIDKNPPMVTPHKNKNKRAAWILWRIRVYIRRCHLYKISWHAGVSKGHSVVPQDTFQAPKSKWNFAAISPNADGTGYNGITNTESTLLVWLKINK